MWHEETLESIRAVRQGEDMPAVGYDSDDDPDVLLNKRIKVRDDRNLPWVDLMLVSQAPPPPRSNLP